MDNSSPFSTLTNSVLYWKIKLSSKAAALDSINITPGNTDDDKKLSTIERLHMSADRSRTASTCRDAPEDAACMLQQTSLSDAILQRLHAAQQLLGRPVASIRQRMDSDAITDQQPGGSAWFEKIGARPESPPVDNRNRHIEPLYSIQDLLHHAEIVAASSTGRTQAPEMGIAYMRTLLADLHPGQRQVGLDDVLHPWFAQQQAAAGTDCASSGSPAAALQLARRGVPMGCRREVWSLALGQLPLTDAAQAEFALLCADVASQQLLTDVFVEAALDEIISSEDFFLFEESLRAVLLAFTRDTSIPRSCRHLPHPRLTGRAPGGGLPLYYPPCGVLPYNGLALYAAPLCYLHQDPAGIYHMFSAMYCRYWCQLHSLSAKPGGLIHLYRVFEAVMQDVEPEVLAHLAGLQVPLAATVLPWLSAAFVGWLSPREVLLLWDRVVGFDSLLPLPVMAAAVFSLRRSVLLGCRSAQEVGSALEDLSQLKVVPLLQAVLFDM